MNNKIKTVSLYAIIHLFVDAACIYVLYSSIKLNNLESIYAFIIIVLYNTLAFGLQAFIGDFFDRHKNPHFCAFSGCILTALSIVLIYFPLLSAVFAGIGNAAFHAGGGIICLKLGNNKAAIPGIYVAPGAMGLFLGALIANKDFMSASFFAVILVVSSVLILFDKLKNNTGIQKDVAIGISGINNIRINKEIIINKYLLILNLLLFAIVIRSFIGLAITIDWKNNIILMFMITLSIVLGKMAGGIIADKFGWVKTTVTALIISSPLIAFGINYPLVYITGIFFFNFTMPVTLTAISNIMQGREGFAFGLTTLALLLGAYPVFAGIKLYDNNALIILSIVAFSAVFIYIGLKEYTKILHKKQEK